MAEVPPSNASVTPSPSAIPSQAESIPSNPTTPPLNEQDTSIKRLSTDALNQPAPTPAQTPHTATNQTQAAKEGYLKLTVSPDAEEVKKANWKQSMAKAFGIGLTVLGVALVIGGIAGTIPALAFGGPAGLLALAAIPIGIAAICYGMNKYEGADNPKNTEWGKLISQCYEKQEANPKDFNAFMRAQFEERTLDLATPVDRQKLSQALKNYDELTSQNDVEKMQADALNSRMQKTTEQLMNTFNENEIKELSAKLKEQRKEFKELGCAAHIPKKWNDDETGQSSKDEYFNRLKLYNPTPDFEKWISDNAQYYPEPRKPDQINAAAANLLLVNEMLNHYQDDLKANMNKDIETLMDSQDEDQIAKLSQNILNQRKKLETPTTTPFDENEWDNYMDNFSQKQWQLLNNDPYFNNWISLNAQLYPAPRAPDSPNAKAANERLFKIMLDHFNQRL